MKKFLTVLLVIAVMFTFSFSSAFAAALDSDVEAELKAYVAQEAQAYYGETGKIAKAYESIFNTLTFDKDGYLNATGNVEDGVVSKELVKAYFATCTGDAEIAFAENVAKFDYDSAKIKDKATVLLALDLAFQGSADDSYTASDITGVMNGVTAATILDTTAKNALYEKQLKADKDAAATALAGINPADYSTNIKEYKIVVKATGAYNATTVSGTLPFDWDDLGLTAGNMTAKEYIEALLAYANAKIAATPASSPVVKTDITAVRNAVDNVKDAVLGHKMESASDYYIAPVMTIADLKGDTTLADAKASAIAQFKAVAASKQMQLANALQTEISKLDKYAKLTDTQKETLATLKKQKEELAENFANLEEVFAANINYKETTTDVENYLTNGVDNNKVTVLGCYNVLGVVAGTGLNNAATNLFDNMARKVDDVAKLKADAELLALQKDVNGLPYYDADVLADNLEDAIKLVYVNGSTYAAVKGMLEDGNEVKLIQAKRAYISFVAGDNAFGIAPKDSKGATATVWKKTTDAGTNSAVATVMEDTATPTPNKKSFTNADLFDKAQKAELKALVDETKKAIEAAKTIGEVEKIFVEANDKYNDIATTKDHEAAWAATGKVGIAYKAADYNKELVAYAKYFIAKVTTTDYPTEVRTVDGVLNAVAFPIVYEAYTVDELAGKVAEAKAAIDAIKTNAEIKTEKAAVEALIKALPAVANVTVADKDAIVAAADARYYYKLIPGYISLANETVLEAVIDAYEAKNADAIDEAYKVLDKKVITTADEDAVKALRAAYDAHIAFVTAYNGGAANETITPTANDIATIERELSDAKVAAVKAMLINLPANPTAADKAQVEAARAAYEALTLAEKAQVVDSLPYKNLIDAEEALGINSDEAAKAYVQDLSIKARSTKTSKGVKVTIKADVQELLDSGYTVEYKFYRSTKSNKNFGTAKITKTENTYLNTSGKKGTKYYYKAKLVVKNAAGEVVATTPLTQCLYATRTF